MQQSPSQKRGVTLIEILLALSILGMVGALALSSLGQYRTNRTLDGNVEGVLALFSRAHLDSISSLGEDMQYGVHLDANQAVYYVGPTYSSAAASNKAYALGPTIEIANISLNPSGSDVLFNRLTGGTVNYGTFEIRAKADPTQRVLFTVNGTGAISL